MLASVSVSVGTLRSPATSRVPGESKYFPVSWGARDRHATILIISSKNRDP